MTSPTGHGHTVGKDPAITPACCRVEIHVDSREEAVSLTNLILPLLQGIDPSLNLITIHTAASMLTHRPNVNMEHIESLIKRTGIYAASPGAHGTVERPGPSTPDPRLRTPSLAVMLFLTEKGPVSTERAQSYLRISPWRFHHKIELSNARMNELRVIGRQEFYQPGRHQPLWSVCPVHYGNQHLRFTIFTRHFSSMVDFYRILVGQEADFTRANFCLFTMCSQPGVDVQIALKQCTQLEPVPLMSAFLSVRVAGMEQLEALVHTPNGTAATLGQLDTNLWLLRDPDGNGVLVEQGNLSERLGPTHRPTPGYAERLGPTHRPTPGYAERLSPTHRPVPGYAERLSPTHRPTPGYAEVQHFSFGGSPQVGPKTKLEHTGPFPLARNKTRGDCWPGSLYGGTSLERRTERNVDVGSVDPCMAESTSSVAHVHSPSVPWTLPCDCDVRSAGSCPACLAKSRKLIRQRLKSSSLNSSIRVKCKPWEIDHLSLSEGELDELLSLTDTY